MKTSTLTSNTLRACFLGVFALIAPSGLHAEAKLETIFTFAGFDGDHPVNLVQTANGDFYGITSSGGKFGRGTLFKAPLNEPMVVLVNFDGANGENPSSRLLESSDGNLYGTTSGGGAHDIGTVYRITPDGKFTTLLSFDGQNGCSPEGDLLLARDGTIYGSAAEGGEHDAGVVFSVKPGEGCRVIANFDLLNGCHPQSLARGEDGVYGATLEGGQFNHGTIFKVTPDNRLTVVYSFPMEGKGSQNPHLSQLKEGSWFGTTETGGSLHKGTVYAMPSGGKPRNLVSFTGDNGERPGTDMVQWSNGYFYMERLFQNIGVRSNGQEWFGVNFCGTTSGGGLHGKGAVYQVTPEGKILTLVSFTGREGQGQGSAPNSLIAGGDGNLYGTTFSGGANNKGTIFRLNFQAGVLPHTAINAIVGLTMSLPPVVSP